MERDDARKVFADYGLTYADVSNFSLDNLWLRCERHLCDYTLGGGFHAAQMSMHMAGIRKKDIKMASGLLIAARLQVNGSYFERREAITFSETGFIGFGGELSGVNVAPFLAAFTEWCTALWEAKQKEAPQ